MSEPQARFDPKLVSNPEPRCPLLLLLDTSFSMLGARIDELNAGLGVLKHSLMQDALVMQRVEIGVTTFGPIHFHDFRTAGDFNPPHLSAAGDTPMGAAIMTGLDRLDARKAEYKASGNLYYRPWVWLITDGGPTDEPDIFNAAAARVRAGEASKKFSFFSVGVQGANLQTLGQLSARPPQKLDGLNFREMFEWLSASVTKVAESNPGDKLALAAPTWAEVEV